MDANGLRFWQLADARHFPGRRHVVWDGARRVLRLAGARDLAPALAPAAAFAVAQGALEAIPRAVDALECVARWVPAAGTAGQIMVHSVLPGEVELLALDETPSDLCAGHDGVFYTALPGQIRMRDLRGRWADIGVSLAGFAPWRLAPCSDGGVWALERVSGRLARLDGYPMPTLTPHPDDYDPRVFRPNPENPRPPRLTLMATPVWDAGETVLGFCRLPDGQPLFLSWRGGDGHAHVRRWLIEENRLGAPLRLAGAEYAYAVAALDGERIAVRVPGRRDAPAFDLADADQGLVAAGGEIYPLDEDAREAPFANGPLSRPRYPAGDGDARPLHSLSIANLARSGEAASYADTPDGFTAHLIDSGDTTTVWHRLYAEARIPAHSGFVVWLAANNEARPPTEADAWHAHGFGRDIATLDAALAAPRIPRAAREHAPSELPGHPGLLAAVPGAQADTETCGLFSVLIQNSRQRVSHLAGRYLWLRLALHGDGRVGPEIAALRAWGSRFSYADHYLPRLYRESLFGAAAAAPGIEVARIEAAHIAALDAGGALTDAVRARLSLAEVETGAATEVRVEQAGAAWLLLDAGRAWRLRHESGKVVGGKVVVYQPQASPADFTARLLCNFEGLLTQFEDRVAAAHLFSSPTATPEANLEWLGAWIGVAFDPALPETRRRDWLAAAPDLARLHGTRQGLRLALDIASGGGVRGGEIVVIEDFRLRRMLATLLGVDLVDETDPLLPGLTSSGNSIVGDTLFLGDHERAELMALYRAGSPTATAGEAASVLDFYARLAHRATVLVHREVEAQDFALIRRVVEMEAPAHVEARVAAATWPLLVGVSSLIGVDTYLGPPRRPRPVQVQRSALGMGDYLIGAAPLDPRLAGAAKPASAPPPAADAGPDLNTSYGASFILDGGGSHAAPGHEIAEYRWRRLPPESA